MFPVAEPVRPAELEITVGTGQVGGLAVLRLDVELEEIFVVTTKLQLTLGAGQMIPQLEVERELLLLLLTEELQAVWTDPVAGQLHLLPGVVVSHQPVLELVFLPGELQGTAGLPTRELVCLLTMTLEHPALDPDLALRTPLDLDGAAPSTPPPGLR